MADRARGGAAARTPPTTAGSPLRLNGMGIASHDVTGDGYPDVYLTSQGANVLQTLPRWAVAARPSGTSPSSWGSRRRVPSVGGDPLPSTSWHPEFADVNNDGFVDLFVSKGNVEDPGGLRDEGSVRPVHRRPDGTFTSDAEAAGIVSFARARGAALADLDVDGLLDLVVVNFQDPVRIWRNVGSGTAAAPVPMGHWLGVQAASPARTATRSARGSTSRPATRRRIASSRSGGGHVGGQLAADPRRPRHGDRRHASASPGRTARSGRGSMSRRTSSSRSHAARRTATPWPCRSAMMSA